MPLGVGIVAIWHCEEIRLKEAEHLVEIFIEQGKIHVAYRRTSLNAILMHIIRQETVHQSNTYLGVRYVKCVQFCRTVVVLDCDVTTLVEQWGYVLHVFGGSVEG